MTQTHSSAGIAQNPLLPAVFIHERLNKLIPYVNENAITYPLCEEGKYIPFLNFWQLAETQDAFDGMDTRLLSQFEKSGYIINYSDNNSTNTIHKYEVYPDYLDTEDGGYEFVKKDWSLEEMIELVAAVIK